MGSGCACGPAPVGPSSPPAAARVAASCRPDPPIGVSHPVLSIANRIRRSREFATVIHHGARARRGSIVLYHHPALTVGAPPRVGFVVGSAVGGSVVRNRVRRQLRAQLRSRLGVLPAGSGTVVRALPTASSDGYRALGADLDGALRRVTLVDTESGTP
jgi:ribonuclease P protein component